jgi:starch synthase
MRMRVLVAHPGTQYSLHLAGQLHRHGLLYRFWTGFALAELGVIGWFMRRLPGQLRQRVATRVLRDVAPCKLRTLPWLEWRSQCAIRRDNAEGVLHDRNRRFQQSIPDREIRMSDVVVGFDTSSWILAERAKALGKYFILDQSIGHPLAKEQVYARVRSLYPEWSHSVPRKDDALVAVERLEHALADAIVVPSTFAAETLRDHGVPPGKLRVIGFGTDLSSVRMPERVAGQSRTFLFVGSMTARKGVPVLLEAWRRLDPGDARLWLAGPGTIPDRVRSGLPRSVTVLGQQTRDEVARLMQQADVFVFPSFFEGLAQVQLEALASGLPVIATHESGASDLVENGLTGLIIPAGDVDATCDAIASLIRAPQRVGDMHRRLAGQRDRWSWSQYGARWASLLQQLPAATARVPLAG